MNTPHQKLLERWHTIVAEAISHQPTASHTAGRDHARAEIVDALHELDFKIVEHVRGDHAPVVVATRAGQGHTIGLTGHYDVEEAGDGWTTPPWQVTTKDGRLYGRGVADNLGPLWLRLVTLQQRTAPTPPLVWVLQGEEEIGSPAAHTLFPELELPNVDLWLEETGYFDLDGTQRLLCMNVGGPAAALVDVVEAAARSDGREVRREARPLNKAFGTHRCPFLSHLLRDRPYLAMGPNDDDSHIHAPDESLPINTIDLSARQFDALLTAATA